MTLRRYWPDQRACPLPYPLTLTNLATNAVVPLANPVFTVQRALAASTGAGASQQTWIQSVPFAPADGTPDPTAMYELAATVTYAEPDATPVAASPVTVSSVPGRLLDGKRSFGLVV